MLPKDDSYGSKVSVETITRSDSQKEKGRRSEEANKVHSTQQPFLDMVSTESFPQKKSFHSMQKGNSRQGKSLKTKDDSQMSKGGLKFLPLPDEVIP